VNLPAEVSFRIRLVSFHARLTSGSAPASLLFRFDGQTGYECSHIRT